MITQDAANEAGIQLNDEHKRIVKVLIISEEEGIRFLTGPLVHAAGWIGKALEEIGQELVVISRYDEPETGATGYAIEYLAQQVDKLAKDIRNDLQMFRQHEFYQHAVSNAYTYIVNAKMQLDQRLKELADEDDDDAELPTLGVPVPSDYKPEEHNAEILAGPGQEVETSSPITSDGTPTLTLDPEPEPLHGEALIEKQKEDLAKVETKALKSTQPTEVSTPQANESNSERTDSVAVKNADKPTGNSRRKK